MSQEAAALVESPAYRVTREKMREAFRRAWIAAQDTNEREKVWSVASGAEMLFSVLERDGTQVDAAEIAERALREVA